jgi:hypothetical protein
MEARPLAPPPFMRDLLVAGYDQVAARPSSQVADDTGFDVDTRWHPRKLCLIDRNAKSWMFLSEAEAAPP